MSDYARFPKKVPFRHVMYGPKYEICDGLVLQLTLCPMGWVKEFKGYVGCYLETDSIPSNISKAIIALTFYLGNIDLVRVVTRYYNDAHKTAVAFDQFSLPFDTLKAWKSIHIECDINIIDIQYKSDNSLGQSLGIVGGKNCRNKIMKFKWDFDDGLLRELRVNNTKHFTHYSTGFGGDEDGDGPCWIMSFNGNYKWNEKMSLAVDMLRIPKVESLEEEDWKRKRYVETGMKVEAYVDNEVYVFEDDYTFSLDWDRVYRRKDLFPVAMLRDVKCLTIMIEIKIKRLKRYLWG